MTTATFEARAIVRARFRRKGTAEAAERRMSELVHRLAGRDLESTTFALKRRGAEAQYELLGDREELATFATSIVRELESDNYLTGELAEVNTVAALTAGATIAFGAWYS